MSSDDVLESPLPGTLGAMPVGDNPVISDSLLHQVMDGHDAEQAAAEQQFQNLQLQSESGSQENDTEAAIPHQHGPEYPATPIDLTMDDSEYAPIDEGEEDYSSGDSVEVIQETQVQEEEVQSTHLAPLEASQMLESHQESAAAPVRDPNEDLGDADIDAEIERRQQEIECRQQEIEREQQEIRHLQQRKAARRARQDQGPEPRNVRARVSPEQGRQVPREQNTLPRQQQMDALFAQRLLKCGMVETQIEADGNCQFRALADQLSGDQERHAELRATAINQLRSEPEYYKGFVHDEDWDSYVRRMEQDREWGDQVTLQAVADAHKVTAHVFSSGPNQRDFPIVLPSRFRDVDQIVRLSHHPEKHYNSVHSSL